MKFFHPKLFRRPELIFRPMQILRRVLWEIHRPNSAVEVKLPWGLSLTVSPQDRIGASILKTGTYDTGILECLLRLVDEGETCLDVGANFGLMTGLLACASGPKGRVISFEPHPQISEDLAQNVARWRSTHEIASITVERTAISDQTGKAELVIPKHFQYNLGSARICSTGLKSITEESINVRTISLDDYFKDSTSEIGVLKIDIEGHEKAALCGAASLLKRHVIRDIIYEDHDGYPSEAGKYLEEFGYKIFLVRKGLCRPLLMPPDTLRYELPNFLATLSPERAEKRLTPFGYKVLKHKQSNA